ncbi:MAG: UDP-3-O-(3-hydroxymyristoyl)glucosamine N-acyltransferase [Candidatus Omnitrophica bacterium]|nr:UDP-3-O-(3-hydroxymyristoyl)glucosamine N-acyltransferase [Candidatus Omnitrophota bacterium]
MRKTLKEIAGLVNGEVIGDSSIVITGANGIKEAEAGDITFLSNPKYYSLLKSTSASAIITSREVFDTDKPVIRVDNPSLAFVKVIALIKTDTTEHPKGIHASAILGKNVKLGKNVSLGAYAVVGDNVQIGDNSVVYPGVSIGGEVNVGINTLIYANVSIREKCIIGNNVIIHSGTVIGSDGFGFVDIDGKHHKVPQVGIVEIGDDVEIGANVTIDRARFGKTIIGSGTKIDNLVQIAHNVAIGKNCLIVAQVGISGSTTIGDNVILAGQVGVIGHITIGDNVIVTAQSGVSKSIPANVIFSGVPARPNMENQRIVACTHNLPKLFDLVKELKKRVDELQIKHSA